MLTHMINMRGSTSLDAAIHVSRCTRTAISTLPSHARAQVGPLAVGVRHMARIVARAASGDVVAPFSGAQVELMPLPRPQGLRVSGITPTTLTLAFRASLPWTGVAYVIRYSATDAQSHSGGAGGDGEVGCVHDESRHAAGLDQTCAIAGLDAARVYSIFVASSL